jgi:hypothetical protein
MNKKLLVTWGVRLGSVALVTAVAGTLAASASQDSKTGDSKMQDQAAAEVPNGSVNNPEGKYEPKSKYEHEDEDDFEEHEYREDEHEKYERGFNPFISGVQRKIPQIQPDTRSKAS